MNAMTKVTYDEFPDFQFVYLEDSWVTGIEIAKGALRFNLVVVLLEGHRLYTPPLPNEQYCYKKGLLSFEKTQQIHWFDSIVQQSRDAIGDIDYGNIDFLWLEKSKNAYHLAGDWGVLEVMSFDIPTLQFD
jgi:hypothetical protein